MYHAPVQHALLAYKFTAKERDSESGLDNFGARYNSSSMGRFMSPDPDNEGAVDLDPQTWNMYSYVRNNPLRYTDPDGKNVLVCIEGQDKCHNYTDEQYASLYKQQNGQQGINLPGGNFPTGDITCGGQKCGTATYFEAPMESDNFVNMLMVAPFAGLVTSSMSAADAAAANAARQTATGATTRAATAAANAGRANTINHIFGKAAHNLAGLVAKLGSKEAAMDALEEATTKQVLSKGINGLFKETVSVAGENVTVKGIVENGVVKIGTAYKP
jgi:RHS repeat-associated protein